MAWNGSTARVPMVLYTRAGCTLCDEMKAEIARAGLEGEYELREVDVDGDRDLKRRFGRRIPVFELAGETIVEGRFPASEFRARFIPAARVWRAGAGAGAEGGAR
ncbi:MAG: glutaredoxin family protein [Planctomycetota bacterium]|nr:MAG: glutaredoxin family protein [Planctomycetota bacterium]